VQRLTFANGRRLKIADTLEELPAVPPDLEGQDTDGKIKAL
jgi:hypothetical protein